MKSSNKALWILIASILFSALCGIYFSITEKNDPNKDLPQSQVAMTDENGDFTPQQLFDQSNETLKYAGHISVSGDARAYKMNEKWYDTRDAQIKYSRDYADEDNYLGNLNVDLSNLASPDGGDTWRYVYKSSAGKLDSKGYRKLDTDGTCGTEGITHPNIEPILFPDISECDLSFEKKKKGKGLRPDTIVYQVTLSGNISSICKSVRSLVGSTIEPTSASYIFDADTHVLKEIYIHSEPSSQMRHNGEDVPLFSMNLSIDKYETMALESLSSSLTEFSDELFDGVINNYKMVVLDENLMECGRTTTYDNLHSSWYRNAALIWDDVYDDGSKKYCLKDLYEKVQQAAAKYDYFYVKLSYAYTGIIQGSRHLLIKFDFYEMDFKVGSIIIPQSVFDGKIVGGRALATLGYGESFDMNMDKFVVTRPNKDLGESKVIGHFEGIYGFRFDLYEATEYAISDLQDETEREHFSLDKNDAIESLAYKYKDADGIGLKYVSLANRDVDNFYSVESFYLPVITDASKANKEYVDDDGEASFDDDCGLGFKDRQRLMDCYKDIGVEDGTIENTLEWTKLKFPN